MRAAFARQINTVSLSYVQDQIAWAICMQATRFA